MNAANPSASALVLFGHGARDPEWAGPMRRIREAALARPGAPRVEIGRASCRERVYSGV